VFLKETNTSFKEFIIRKTDIEYLFTKFREWYSLQKNDFYFFHISWYFLLASCLEDRAYIKCSGGYSERCCRANGKNKWKLSYGTCVIRDRIFQKGVLIRRCLYYKVIIYPIPAVCRYPLAPLLFHLCTLFRYKKEISCVQSSNPRRCSFRI
jgi:hypothetical protein